MAPGSVPAGPPVASAGSRTGPLSIDGRLSEADWAGAPIATGFIQQKPEEGRLAVHQTQVRVLFDNEAMYVGAHMVDPEPTSIARQMTRRDEEGQFDYFAVEVDPLLDRRTGYRFRVSASNVQRDEYMFDDNERDAAWDAVWESAVSFDSTGWTVELRIPLSQIRYRPAPGVQRWGVNFFRRRLATNEESHFALISQLQRGHVSQYGLLDEVRVTQASRRLELRPYVLSSAWRGPAPNGDPFNDGSDYSGRAGIDLRYGLGGQFTLDATINPDFGQVESDPAVINLTAFETFLDERRPFFVEDARIFDFSLSGGRNRVFYSRRIGRNPHGGSPDDATYSDIPEAATILGAAKLTGRTSRGLSVGFLASVTQAEQGRAWFDSSGTTEHFLVEPRTAFGVGRVRQDFNGGASTLGVIGTVLQRDLPANGAFDYLPGLAIGGGFDWEHQWNDRTWAFFGYVAGSLVRGDSVAMIRIQRSSVHYFQRPDSRRLHVDSTATSMGGYDWRMTLEKRRGEHWTGSIWAAQVSPGFEINDLGFSSRQEVLDGGMRIAYREIRPGSVFRSYNVSASTFHNYSHDLLSDLSSKRNWALSHVAGTFSLQANAQLLNYWRLEGNFSLVPDRMDRSATRGGPLMLNPGGFTARMGLDTDSRRVVTFGPNVSLEHGSGNSGSRLSIRTEIGLRPASWLDLRVAPDWSRTVGPQYVGSTSIAPFAPTFGRSYVFADLERREFSIETRLNAAFSPTLSLQLYMQPLLSAGDYLTYARFLEPGTYSFDRFQEGTFSSGPGGVSCAGGRTCVDGSGIRYIDFEGDSSADYSFTDRDFNVRSLRGNAVFRWEYAPGSTLFLVWQRRQADEAMLGDFSFRRDFSALLRARSENVFMIKARYWLGF